MQYSFILTKSTTEGALGGASHRTTVWGCRYSSSYRSYAPNFNPGRPTASVSPEDGIDICAHFGASKAPILSCAIEIFSIFLLSVVGHLAPLTDEGVFEAERRCVFTIDSYSKTISRHPEIEVMVELLSQRAPLLFSEESELRTLLVSAFQYNDLLPQAENKTSLHSQIKWLKFGVNLPVRS